MPLTSIFRTTSVLVSFTFSSLPLVSRFLGEWRQKAQAIPDETLRRQALASIDTKRFHCQGGSCYAVPAGRLGTEVVRAIVALQTISDYLDNLCDRAGVLDEASFRQLHLAMTEALTPGDPISPYYALYPSGNDGGYLEELVSATRTSCQRLPGFDMVSGRALVYVSLYSDLQSLKHLEPKERSGRLQDWHVRKGLAWPGIHWWEFAAACGSTLGIFALLALASQPGSKSEVAEALCQAYFPYISGLHILLDYLIDMEEDAREGDFNLVAPYQSASERGERLGLFVERAMEGAALLPDSHFHRTVVRGLLAMYLSDPKVKEQGLVPLARELAARGGPGTSFMTGGCRALRAAGVI
ncbi:MAG: tetraprenyl-beta-curcumene synthase family protein [Bacillota bacterium]